MMERLFKKQRVREHIQQIQANYSTVRSYWVHRNKKELDRAKGWVSKKDLLTCDLVSLAESMGGK